MAASLRWVPAMNDDLIFDVIAALESPLSVAEARARLVTKLALRRVEEGI
jgi:hypothetical protein